MTAAPPSPDILAIEAASVSPELLSELATSSSGVTVDAVGSVAAAERRLAERSPSVLVLPVDCDAGDWRALVDAVVAGQTACVIVDLDERLSPEAAAELGAADYVDCLDESRLPIVTNRLVELARGPTEEPSEGLRPDPRGRQQHTVLDRITDAFFALNRDWEFTYVNQQALDLTATTSDELLGERIWDAFPEIQGSEYEAAYREAMATQETVSFKAYFEPLDMWTDVRAYPSPSGLSVYYHDVTEQLRGEQERELLTNVTHIAAEATSFEGALEDVLTEICDQTELVYGEAWAPDDERGELRTVVTYGADVVSDEFEALTADLGFAPGNGLPGRVWESNEVEWIPDVSAASTSEFQRTNVLGGEIQAALGVPIAVEGDVVAVLTFFLPHERERDMQFVEAVRSAASSIGAVLVRQRAIDRLQHERELQERVFDTSPVGIAVVDADQRIVRANDALVDILGYTKSEITSQTNITREWEISDPSGERESFSDLAVGRVLETGASVHGLEHSLVRGDGSRVWIRVHAQPMYDARGDVEFVVAAVQDVTQERAQERALDQQREQISVMNRILRHDLRTHTNVVLGFVDMLERGDVSLETATAKMTERLEGLLTTAEKTRRATQHVELSDRRPQSVESLAAACGSRLERRVDDPALEVSVSAPDDVHVDSTNGLEMALVELLENASLYSSDDAPVTMTIDDDRTDESTVCIQITDQGPGIPEIELQVLNAGKETPLSHSSGIGIWLARWLIEAHDGSLTIRRHDDGGTECSVVLPTVDPESDDG